MFGSKDSTTHLEDEEKVVSEADAGYAASADHDADGRTDETDETDETDDAEGRPADVNRARGTVYSTQAQYDDAQRTDEERAHDSVGVAPAPTDASQVAPIAVAPVGAVAPDETVRRSDDADDADTGGPDSTDAVYEESAAVDEATPVEETAPPQDLKPGEAEGQPVTAFVKDTDAQDLRDRWRELQLRFIDDPQSVAAEAQDLVDEAVASVTASLSESRDALGNWREGPGDDTERLRAAVRGYRDFLDRVLGL